MVKAVYPGIFDPITRGHIDIIGRASILFDSLDVVVGHNLHKKTLFSVEERVRLIREVTKELGNVSVSSYSGLTVDYLKSHSGNVLVRGLRAVSDFEYEFQMALMNKKLWEKCETIYLMPKENYTYLSSSVVKEIASMGGPVTEFVTANVEKALAVKIAGKSL